MPRLCPDCAAARASKRSETGDYLALGRSITGKALTRFSALTLWAAVRARSMALRTSQSRAGDRMLTPPCA